MSSSDIPTQKTSDPTDSSGPPPPGPASPRDALANAPDWAKPLIRWSIWRVILYVLITIVLIWMAAQARSLLSMVAISFFFGIALIPGVNWLHERRGWRRGAAVGFIYLAGFVFMVVLVMILIPAIAQFAEAIRGSLPDWINNIDAWAEENLGVDLWDDGTGEDVAAGAVLMTVYAPESRLEARLFLSPGNAGVIAVGQRVELQLQAYPHQLFGTQSAVVTAISTIVLPPEQVDADVPVKGPVFVVRARLRQARIQAGSRSWSLPPGTSFQADLVRARWPLYRWLLRSVSGDPARS